MTACTKTQPGDECKVIFCESGLQQWQAMPGDHFCHVEDASAVTCLEVKRFIRPYFCLQPRSFGYTNDVFPPAIRVRYGCSAEFKVCFSSIAFSDSIYRGSRFQYIDHSDEYKMTTGPPSSVFSTTESVIRNTYRTSTSTTTESLSMYSTSTTDIRDVNVTNTTFGVIQNRTSDPGHRHNGTEVLHRSSVGTVNSTTAALIAVPVACIFVILVVLLALLWKRAKRKELSSMKTDPCSIENQEGGTNSKQANGRNENGCGTPGDPCENIQDRVIAHNSCNGSSNHNEHRHGDAGALQSIDVDKPSTQDRNSDHPYYVLEKGSGVNPTPHKAVNRLKMSEEMYDNLRNRWSENSEGQYDHMPSVYATLGHRNSGIMGNDYAHLEST